MPQDKNLIGKRFGKLTVIAMDGVDANGAIRWICRCDCGNMRTVRSFYLLSGYTTHCRGCGKNPNGETKPDKRCKYSFHINCQEDDPDCYHCGWCPAVSERRRKLVKAELSKK